MGSLASPRPNIRRQLQALARVRWLAMWRGPVGDRGSVRKVAGALLVLLELWIVVSVVRAMATALVELKGATPLVPAVVTRDHVAAARVVLWAVFGLAAFSRLKDEVDGSRHDAAARVEEGWLSALPLSRWVRALTAIGSGVRYILILAVFGSAVGVFGVVAGVALAFVALAIGDVLALAIARLPRYLLGVAAFLRALGMAGFAAAVLVFAGMALFRAQLAATPLDGADPSMFLELARLWPVDHASKDPMYFFAAALLDGNAAMVASVTTSLAVAAFALRASLPAAERAARAGGAGSGARATLSRFEMERLLVVRRAPWIVRNAVPLLCAVAIAIAAIWLAAGRPLLGATPHDAYVFSLSFTMLIAGQACVRRASAHARDDVAARALLASLPLTPAATLRHKRALVQAYAVGFAAGPLFMLATFRSVTPSEALRFVELVVVLLLIAQTAVSVAFLTEGNGRDPRRSSGVRFEQTLMLLPLVGLMLDVSPLNHGFAALSLVLLSFEARRAAERCVRWSDDADPDVAKDTEVWRALLVFAAFFPMQLLIHALASSLVPESVREWRVVVAYGASGAVLALLTFRGHATAPPMQPSRWLPAWLVAGACGGTVAILVSLSYVRFVLGVPLPHEPAASVSALIATAVLVGGLAPAVEEYYFRGWFQSAIARAMPERWRWLAFAPAAFAFSAVHVGSEHVPIFVLGCIAGVLAMRSGSLAPAILAHSAYNLGLLGIAQ